jgi:protein-disulfide isomerase
MHTGEIMKKDTINIVNLTLCMLAFASFGPGLVQAHAEPMTQAQGDAIINELKQIRQLLERQPQAPSQAVVPAPRPDERASTSVAGVPALGKTDAPLTMVMFTDYQCPFSRRFETQTLPEIKRQYIDTGKLRFVVRDLPLEFHANAPKAAEATHCAGEQGKYWELRDKLSEHADKLEAKFLPEYAQQAGLNVPLFSACLESGRFTEKVKTSVTGATAQNISGTPTFVVGRMKGDTVEGVKLVGALPFSIFDQKLKELLRAVVP